MYRAASVNLKIHDANIGIVLLIVIVVKSMNGSLKLL